MKILVTGATGFLGHHLTRRLVKAGFNVRILKEKGASLNLIEDLKLETIEGDIRDFEVVKRAVKGCEIVFHLAALISYWDKLNPLQYEVNVIGTENIVKNCLEEKVKRLIHVSSTAAIGTEPEGKLANEETSYNLWGFKINYCNTKYLGEIEVRKGIDRGLDAVILCPGSMYGAGDIRRIKEDPFFSQGIFSLFYIRGGLAVVDVEDVADGLILAWKKGKSGQRYILASENLTFFEIKKTISEFLGKEPPKICLPYPIFLALAYTLNWLAILTKKRPKITSTMARFNKIYFYFSAKKARKKLGMKFRSFKESIKKAIDWYKENGYL
ncbi:SDR family oxidoreductase [Patescibacteria group bacterium]|nr:SDR family oxidoreductase [Patescibacteria group bacterium]